MDHAASSGYRKVNVVPDPRGLTCLGPAADQGSASSSWHCPFGDNSLWAGHVSPVKGGCQQLLGLHLFPSLSSSMGSLVRRLPPAPEQPSLSCSSLNHLSAGCTGAHQGLFPSLLCAKPWLRMAKNRPLQRGLQGQPKFFLPTRPL